MRFVAHRDELTVAFERGDPAALVALASGRPGRVVRFLMGRLYSVDADEKWRAVRALGALARAPGILTEARALDLLQRFLWALNDESGAVPYGVPEAIGEILAARPEHRASILPILCGMLTEEETFQTGAVERGIDWALGRIGPDVVSHCPHVVDVVAANAPAITPTPRRARPPPRRSPRSRVGPAKAGPLARHAIKATSGARNGTRPSTSRLDPD